MNTNAFPALTGDVVTEGHARICRERGHATHTVSGVDTGTCPRCGEVTTSQAPTVPTVSAFDVALENYRALGHDYGTAAQLAAESVARAGR